MIYRLTQLEQKAQRIANMGDPLAETTQYTTRNNVKNRTELLCHQSGISTECKDVLLHISASIDSLDSRMDTIQNKLAKGDPEQTKIIAVLQDRVNTHQHIFAAVGLALLGQMTAIIFALMK